MELDDKSDGNPPSHDNDNPLPPSVNKRSVEDTSESAIAATNPKAAAGPAPKKLKVQTSQEEATNVLKCIKCEESKELQFFSKKQRKKPNPSCLDCNQMLNTLRRKELNGRKLYCTLCAEDKCQFDFFCYMADPTLENDLKRVCKTCCSSKGEEAIKIVMEFKQEKLEKEREKQEALEKEKAVKLKEISDKFHIQEEKEYKSCKIAYDKHVQSAKDQGRDVEQEMVQPSRYVYVITSFQNYDPKLYGIYTTCAQAKEALPQAFELITKGNFAKGEFQNDPQRVAKLNVSEFVSPLMTCGRVMFESHKQDKDDSWANYFASMAINRVPLNQSKYREYVPLLHHENIRYSPVKIDNEAVNIAQDGKVYVIYKYSNTEDSEKAMDFYLGGVFTKKEDALVATGIFKDNKESENSDAEEEEDDDDDDFIDKYYATKEEALAKENGILKSVDSSMDRSVEIYSTGILTVKLDEVADFGITLHNMDVWMNPRPSIFDEYV